MDDEAIVVQVDASVLHQNADACDVAAVIQTKIFAELLTENIRWSFQVLDFNAGPQVPVFLHQVPVFSIACSVLDVGVEEKLVRFVVTHRRFQHDVIDEAQREFVEADKVDDVGDDETIGARLVIEILEKCFEMAIGVSIVTTQQGK